jgi:hypothetical protein
LTSAFHANAPFGLNLSCFSYMEPIIASAIISGILCGAAGGISTVATTELIAAYKKLRGILQKKFGQDSILLRSIGSLEERPESKVKQDGVAEDIAESGADKDAEIIKAAEALLAEIKKQPGGEKAVQTVIGGSGHIFSQSGNVTVTR